MDKLKDEILQTLERDGGWMPATGIFNRVDAAKKQHVTDELDRLEKAGMVQSMSTVLGVLYALPHVQASGSRAKAEIRHVSPDERSPSSPVPKLTASSPSLVEIETARTDILATLKPDAQMDADQLALAVRATRATVNFAISRLLDNHTVERVRTPAGVAYRLRARPAMQPRPVVRTAPLAEDLQLPAPGTLQRRIFSALCAAGAEGLLPQETLRKVGGHAGSVITTLSLMARCGLLVRVGPGARRYAPSDAAKALQASAGALPVEPPMPSPRATSPVSVVAAHPRFALLSDDTLVMELEGRQPIVLAPRDSRELRAYLSQTPSARSAA